MALGLTGDDDGVVAPQAIDVFGILGGDVAALRIGGHLRSEHRVVLRERVTPLDAEVGLAETGDSVEEHGLLDCRHQRVTDAAEHRVVGPHGEVVLAGCGERARVVQQVTLPVVGVEPETASDLGIEVPATLLHVLDRDQGEGIGMPALVVDEPDGMEDLHRLMRVHGRQDASDVSEIAVDELRDAPIVVDRAGARAPCDVELELGKTERVLHVHQQQADARTIFRRRLDFVLRRPLARLARTRLVGHAPDVADSVRREVRRYGKLSTWHDGVKQ